MKTTQQILQQYLFSHFQTSAANFDQNLVNFGQTWSSWGPGLTEFADFVQTSPNFARIWRPTCENGSNRTPRSIFCVILKCVRGACPETDTAESICLSFLGVFRRKQFSAKVLCKALRCGTCQSSTQAALRNPKRPKQYQTRSKSGENWAALVETCQIMPSMAHILSNSAANWPDSTNRGRTKPKFGRSKPKFGRTKPKHGRNWPQLSPNLAEIGPSLVAVG